jgi:hypothetical protein
LLVALAVDLVEVVVEVRVVIVHLLALAVVVRLPNLHSFLALVLPIQSQ